MKVEIVGRHMTVTPAIESYAREKSERLERYFDQIQTISVVLSSEGDRHAAEMIVAARVGGKFVAHIVDSDMYAAIDLLVDKMERQLSKQKEKVKLHRKSDKIRALEELSSAAEAERAGAEDGPAGVEEWT